MLTDPDGFKILRSYSSLIYLALTPGNQLDELEINVKIALFKINSNCRSKIVKKLKHEDFFKVIFEDEGCIFKYGDSANDKGFCLNQGSRFGIAWWTNPEKTRKSVRLFGDRIKPIEPYLVLPHLYPFGLNYYNIVYPESISNPDHCFKCKKNLINDEISHVENPSRFLCASCKYLHDTGFLPTRISNRKHKK